MLNISKKRKFSKPGDNCPYHTYQLTRKQRGNYVNVWFPGEDLVLKKSQKVARNNQFYYENDRFWTIKKVDKRTADHLYNREWNPISIFINRSYSEYKKDKDTTLCDMKAQIHSIDDSSYGIWWIGRSKEDLEPIRLKIMEWIDSQPILNGDKFIEFCLLAGANPDSVDYN